MKTIYLFGFLIFMPFLLYSQQALVYEISQTTTSTRSSKILQQISSAPTTKRLQPVAINFGLFAVQTEVQFSVFNRVVRLQRDRLEKRSAEDFSWVGTIKNGSGQAVISCKGKDVTGVIFDGTNVYSLKTLPDSTYLFVEVDQSKFAEGCDNLKVYSVERQNSIDLQPGIAALANQNIVTNVTSNPNRILQGANYSCKLRVLVLYTPAAKAAVSNIDNEIQQAINVSNQTYVNSNLDNSIKLELAYVNQTAYTESPSQSNPYGIQVDLDRFYKPGDGYMDEVHDLRLKYSADVCVLFCRPNPNGIVGLAQGIAVAPNEAFCVVDPNAASSNLSFPHEIGHLIGCRHDPYVDPDSTPYAYGHGYVNVAAGWRTVMAYNNQCADAGTSCTRILGWSNPDVTYLGSPIGDVTIRNNARVMNEQFANAIAFNQPPAIVVLDASNVDVNESYGDIIATDKIYNSEPVTITTSNSLYLHATNSIRLLPGFKVNSGAIFYAFNDPVGTCSSTALRTALEQPSDRKTLVIDASTGSQITVYPNPFTKEVTISYSLTNKQRVSLFIYDVNGYRIAQPIPGELQVAGRHQVVFNAANLAAGVYIYQLITDGKVQTGKIVKAE